MKMKATTRKPSLKTKSLSYTGERFIPEEKTSVMTLEHYHRYRFAQKYCHNKKVLDIDKTFALVAEFQDGKIDRIVSGSVNHRVS